jgi:uncharacterized lipoprotein YddW (UPF0748 family)
VTNIQNNGASHLQIAYSSLYSNFNMVKLLFLLVGLSAVENAGAQAVSELRGAWVATVTNIDWPSQNYLSPEQQRAEFVRLLDVLQQNRINAIFVQVRPAADAFYDSPYEPWSEWLTGKQGRAPEPYYDPLTFMIQEAHKRNMEFHAWFNPYRAVMKLGHSSIANNHITRTHPEWFVNYGAQKLFNPGLPEVRAHINKIIKDVLERYEVDGIHFDDYFYPYPIDGRPFHDEAAYRKYGNGMEREDWRRSNVDSVIYQVFNTIKAVKPGVKFGVSPFGVWRNAEDDQEGSDTHAGLTNYDDLYADILLWLENGWIDYAAPQLYWEIGHNKAAFEVLADWWSKHSYGKHIYIGHGMYRGVERKTMGWRRKSELPDQISLLRQYPEIKGSIFFNATNFYKNPFGWCDSLQNNYYSQTASVPPMPWLTEPVSVVQPERAKPTRPAAKPTRLAEVDSAVQPEIVAQPVVPVVSEEKKEKKEVQIINPAPNNSTPVNATPAMPVLITSAKQTGNNVYEIVLKKELVKEPIVNAIKLYISYDESMVFEKSRQYNVKTNCDSCVFEVRFAPVKSRCRLFVTYVFSDGRESKPVGAGAEAGLYFEKTDAIKNNWIQK